MILNVHLSFLAGRNGGCIKSRLARGVANFLRGAESFVRQYTKYFKDSAIIYSVLTGENGPGIGRDRGHLPSGKEKGEGEHWHFLVISGLSDPQW